MTMSKGEVWLVDLSPTVGDEIRKTRPVVIVNNDAVGILALRVIVPITAWQPKFQKCHWMVPLDPDGTNGLDKASIADTFQVRSLSVQRFSRKLGPLTEADLNRLADGLRAVFDL
jgi:mRNA interferase MazF